MRIASVLLLFVMLGLTTSPAMADPANVEPKEWHNNYSWVRAEYPEQEPNDTCPGQSTACGDVVNPAYLNPGEQDWYSFHVDAGIPITVGTDAVNPGDNTDTYIELYFECGGTILAQDDDSGPGFYSLITNFNAPSTGTYNVKVRGYSQTSQGPYKIFFNCTPPPPPPANDRCDGAFTIDRCTAGSLEGDLTSANNDYDPPSQCTGFSAAGKDVVYYMDLQVGDIVDLTYNQVAYDASFYIVTDCSNLSTCVAGADDGVTGDPEVIHYVAAAAGRYYLVLDTYGTGTGGAWTLDYMIQCPGPPTGACCYPGQVCIVQTQTECSGAYQGNGTDCDPNPCPPTASEDRTWGQIKSAYR